MTRTMVSLDTVTFKTKGNVGGWAFWKDETLQSCGIYANLIDLTFLGLAQLCVSEKPKYRGRGSNVDPQDMIDLAWDGALAAAYCGRVVLAVEPNEWKGQLPKHVVETRVRKRLDETETQTLLTGLTDVRASWQHNVIEAVGLGLWKLGRL